MGQQNNMIMKDLLLLFLTLAAYTGWQNPDQYLQLTDDQRFFGFAVCLVLLLSRLVYRVMRKVVNNA